MAAARRRGGGGEEEETSWLNSAESIARLKLCTNQNSILPICIFDLRVVGLITGAAFNCFFNRLRLKTEVGGSRRKFSLFIYLFFKKNPLIKTICFRQLPKVPEPKKAEIHPAIRAAARNPFICLLFV